MPNFIRSIAACTLLVLANCYCYAAFSISGQISDKQTGTAVYNANIFLAGTTFGTTSNASGHFELTVPSPGNYKMVVSHVSYFSMQKDLFVNNDLDNLDFALEPKMVELEGVTVTFKDENRPFYCNMVKYTLLGDSKNSLDCKIEGLENLRFRISRPDGTFYDNDSTPSKNKIGELEAFCDTFLVIENKQLAYRIKYKLEKFSISPYRTIFYGYPLFEDLIDQSHQKKAVYRRRLDAYYGSIPHFFKSLYNNKLAQNGFAVYALDETSAPIDSIYHKTLVYKDYSTQKAYMYSQTDNKVVLELYCSSSDTSKYLHYPNSFEVAYDYREELAYQNGDGRVNFIEKREGKQVSLFIRSFNHEPLQFDNYGLVSVDAIRLSGYMTWKRLADLLPLDFNEKDAVDQLIIKPRRYVR